MSNNPLKRKRSLYNEDDNNNVLKDDDIEDVDNNDDNNNNSSKKKEFTFIKDINENDYESNDDLKFLLKVIENSDIKKWEKGDKSGSFFKTIFIDENGDIIRGAFFGDECIDKFFNYISKGNVYEIYRFKLKKVNENFKIDDNEKYEINFFPWSHIKKLSIDDSSVTKNNNNKFSSLEENISGGDDDNNNNIKKSNSNDNGDNDDDFELSPSSKKRKLDLNHYERILNFPNSRRINLKPLSFNDILLIELNDNKLKNNDGDEHDNNQNNYNYLKNKYQNNKIVDIVGVCCNVDEPTTKKSYKTGKNYESSSISLMNKDNVVLKIKIWGDKISNFFPEIKNCIGKIIGLYSIKITRFNSEISLNTSNNSEVIFNITPSLLNNNSSLKYFFDELNEPLNSGYFEKLLIEYQNYDNNNYKNNNGFNNHRNNNDYDNQNDNGNQNGYDNQNDNVVLSMINNNYVDNNQHNDNQHYDDRYSNENGRTYNKKYNNNNNNDNKYSNYHHKKKKYFKNNNNYYTKSPLSSSSSISSPSLIGSNLSINNDEDNNNENNILRQYNEIPVFSTISDILNEIKKYEDDDNGEGEGNYNNNNDDYNDNYDDNNYNNKKGNFKKNMGVMPFKKFKVKGYFVGVKNNTSICYPSGPGNKRARKTDDGKWVVKDKNNNDFIFDEPIYKYAFESFFKDDTGECLSIVFNNTGKKIFKKNAREYMDDLNSGDIDYPNNVMLYGIGYFSLKKSFFKNKKNINLTLVNFDFLDHDDDNNTNLNQNNE